MFLFMLFTYNQVAYSRFRIHQEEVGTALKHARVLSR